MFHGEHSVQQTTNLGVGGSNPPRRAISFISKPNIHCLIDRIIAVEMALQHSSEQQAETSASFALTVSS